MKKSIYKVTGWSLAIAAAIVFGLTKNTETVLKTTGTQGIASSIQETTPAENGGNNYNTDAYYNNDYASNSQNIQGENINIAPSNLSETQNKDIAAVPSMGIMESNNSNESSANTVEESNTQDAWAKGGPSVSEYNATQQYNNAPSSSNIGTVSAPSSSSSVPSSGSSSVTVARVSGPTVVTTPPNPSGGSSGGSSGGDPFVPIDDYYGLIFLVAVSTVIGVFTIKKGRIV